MKKLAVLPFFVLGLAAATNAQADFRKYLDGAYTELHDGFKTMKVEPLQKFFDKYGHPKFIYIGAKGEKQTSKQLLSHFKAGMGPGMKLTKSTNVIGKIRVTGDTALVPTTGDWVMVVTPPKGKAQTMAGKTIMTDTWVKTPGGWKLRESKVISEKATLDGKPIPG